MSTKAIPRAIPPRPTRARLWMTLREHKQKALSLDVLSDKAGVVPDTALHHLQGLVKAGYVAVTKVSPKKGFSKNMYQLIKDTGVDAPLIKNDGSESVVGVKNANMWRTMRMLKTFTYVDIEAHASTTAHEISVATVRQYIKALHKAGYLACVRMSERKLRNGGQTPSVYQLVKDTGAKAPMVQKLKTVYDQNLNRVMYQDEAGNCDE